MKLRWDFMVDEFSFLRWTSWDHYFVIILNYLYFDVWNFSRSVQVESFWLKFYGEPEKRFSRTNSKRTPQKLISLHYFFLSPSVLNLRIFSNITIRKVDISIILKLKKIDFKFPWTSFIQNERNALYGF